MTNNLSGIPSIVFGLFGMALFVNYMDFGDSILAGSLTLGLLSLPLVIRTTEEALKAIPDNLREGSRALGATKLQTIWHVILPMGNAQHHHRPVLALGRVSGETAPILFTCAAYFLPQRPAVFSTSAWRALSSVRHLHQRYGYGSPAAYCLWNGLGLDTDNPSGKSAGQCSAEIFREENQNELNQ